MTTAFGVAPDSSGQGCDAMTHRRVIASQWVNTGIITGLEVSGRQDLRYGVSPGAAVCSMGDADGMSIAWWDGAGSPYTEDQVAAGDSAYPRIDAVYMIAHTGQPDNLVHVKAAQGEPSASPVPPRVEAGGQVLAYMRLPAGATSTRAAVPWGDVDYAVQYGSGLGKLAESWSRQSYTGGGRANDNQAFYEQKVSFYLPTDRELEFRYNANFSASDGKSAELGVAFRLDDGDLEGSGAVLVSKDGSWTSHSHVFTQAVSRGSHTACVMKWWAAGSAPSYHYGNNHSGFPAYVGQRFQIFDRGVAR